MDRWRLAGVVAAAVTVTPRQRRGVPPGRFVSDPSAAAVVVSPPPPAFVVTVSLTNVVSACRCRCRRRRRCHRR